MRIVSREHYAGPEMLKFKMPINHTEEVDDLADELEEYMRVLLGHKDPPINEGIMTLMEIAAAYYARAQEMNRQILRWEREGIVRKGSPTYKFRTGELRNFLDLTRKLIDVGSRRLTHEQFLQQMRYDDDGVRLNWVEDE